MISLGLLGATLLALGFLPLLGGPRYEAALLAGLIVPTWVALRSAAGTRKRISLIRGAVEQDEVIRRLPALNLLAASLSQAVAHGFVVLLVALLHGLIGGFCEPKSGFILLLLGPIFGGLLGAAWGTLVGGALGVFWARATWFSRLLGAVLCVALPLGSAFLELLGFYNSPTVYAYDAFAGYFSGPLYDTVEYELPRLLVFRVGTLCTLACATIWSGLVVLRFSKESGVQLGSWQDEALLSARRVLLFGLGLAFGLGSVWHSAESENLGLSGSTASIRAALGRQLKLGACRVHFSTSVSAETATRIAQECVGHLRQLEAYFEEKSPAEVQVYLFADAEEKRQLMGAGRTNIAKPWRQEVYIQPDAFPHPVLGHELAHVVTGAFGEGPLRVAGPWGGLIPDPGRVEGFAEAASPRENSEGTLREWTAAMKQLNLLPPLEQIFRLGFWGNSAARSYSAAGSFVDFVHQERGPEALKAWYAGGSLEALTERSWAEWEKDWHAYLDVTVVPKDVLEIARPRFSRPGVFERRCPHAVDRRISEAQSVCGVQELKARRLVQEAVALDAARADVELLLPACSYKAGRVEESQTEAKAALRKTERYSPSARRQAIEFLGDSFWLEGKIKEATAEYKQALELTFRRDLRRRLEFKLWALSLPDQPREAVRSLLVPRGASDMEPGVVLAGWFHEGPEKEMAAYLLMRSSLHAGRVDQAAFFSAQLEPGKLPLKRVQREASRTQLLVACAALMDRGGQDAGVKEALQAYRALGLSPAEELEATRVSERCMAPGLHE